MQATPLTHWGPETSCDLMACRASNNKHAVNDFLYCCGRSLAKSASIFALLEKLSQLCITMLHIIYHITNDKQRIWTLRHNSEWQERVFAMERKYSSTVCKLTILKRYTSQAYWLKRAVGPVENLHLWKCASFHTLCTLFSCHSSKRHMSAIKGGWRGMT